MHKLHCCKDLNFEYESRRSQSNSTSKLHQPSSTRLVLRIRELLSVFRRTWSCQKKRKTSSKRVDERKRTKSIDQHVGDSKLTEL